MRLYDFKGLFTAPDFDYLKFPEARTIVKQVTINPKLLLQNDLEISKSVKNLLAKDLNKCEKSKSITVLFLKIREFFLGLSIGYSKKRNIALDTIRDYATKIAKEVLKT